MSYLIIGITLTLLATIAIITDDYKFKEGFTDEHRDR